MVGAWPNTEGEPMEFDDNDYSAPKQERSVTRFLGEVNEWNLQTNKNNAANVLRTRLLNGFGSTFVPTGNQPMALCYLMKRRLLA